MADLQPVTFTVTFSARDAWDLNDDMLAVIAIKGKVSDALFKIARAFDDAVRESGQPVASEQEMEQEVKDFLSLIF